MLLGLNRFFFKVKSCQAASQKSQLIKRSMMCSHRPHSGDPSPTKTYKFQEHENELSIAKNSKRDERLGENNMTLLNAIDIAPF